MAERSHIIISGCIQADFNTENNIYAEWENRIGELRNGNKINVNGQIARREVFSPDAWLDDRRS